MSAVEVVAARVNIGRYATVVVYRPGSDAIQPKFYNMSTVLEAVAT